MKIVFILIMLTTAMFGVENVSLSKLLMKFQGNEYNVLLAPTDVVMASRGRKTRKAIGKGYRRAIGELTRLVIMRNIDLNMKPFKKEGSNLPQYMAQDAQTYTILKNMLHSEITLTESINIDDAQSKKKSAGLNKKVSASDVSMDADFGDDAFDISNDKGTGAGGMENLSPASIFTESFVELSQLYNQQVLQLYKAKHPFNIKGMAKMKPVNSVFGMAFFPTKYGAIKMMKIDIILCNINTEKEKSVQIVVKRIKPFRWDRNYLYISGATGKILRQIVSDVLGESFK